MATNTARAGSRDDTVPAALPVDLHRRSRLSWELGTRVVDDGERRGRWGTDRGWELAVFDVTSETVVVRVGTPAGRELFYGAETAAYPRLRSELEAAPEWRRVE